MSANLQTQPVKPKSNISVMMIIAFVFEQMFCHFEGAMRFHRNRKAPEQDDNKMVSIARNSLLSDLV